MDDGAEPARADAPMQESRWLTPDERAAWMSLAGLMIKLPSALDAQLQHDCGLNLFEYFVLSGLSETPEHTLRMSELAVLTNGSLSRLSHVVKRLEQRGWIRRESCPEDGRYTNAILTPEGWEKVVESAPGHVEAVRHLVIDPLTVAQRRTLQEIGRRVQGRIDPSDLDPCASHTTREPQAKKQRTERQENEPRA